MATSVPNRAFNTFRRPVVTRSGETVTGEATPERQAARKREAYLSGAHVPNKGPTIYPPLGK